MVASGSALTRFLCIALVGVLVLFPWIGRADSGSAEPVYVFDDNMLLGSSLGAGGIARFNEVSKVPAGEYRVDVFLNSEFIGRHDVTLEPKDGLGVVACLHREWLEGAGVLSEHIHAENDHCVVVSRDIEAAQEVFHGDSLRLDLSVPQSLMRRIPRGYVDPVLLDPGESMAFINYNASHYHADRSGGGSSDNAYLGVRAGVNAGLWRLRSLGTLNYSDDKGHEWQSSQTYVQRALPSWRSELTLGDSYSNGRHFSGLAYRGLSLSTDQRMLPDSMRGYAPEVRGTARTNARVVIRQNGVELYQTTVPPGAFLIDDLYPTSVNGDLEVEVHEADGQISRYRVPFSSVPGSLRPGQSQYSMTAGVAREWADGDDPFADLVYEHGLSNSMTANGGLRVAKAYQAVMMGGVYASPIGALGLDVTYSNADLPGGYRSGYMARVNYSRTFNPTGTTFSLATYRYSSDGYRDLSDVLGLRAAHEQGADWTSRTYLQRSRFDVNVSQRVGERGSLYLAGLTQDYRDGRDRDYQYQIGYSHRFHSQVNLDVSFSRQEMGRYGDEKIEDEHTLMVSVSAPLGRGSYRPNVTASVTRSRDGGSQIQSAVSGVVGKEQSLSYGAYATRDTGSDTNMIGANVQKQLPKVSLGGSVSRGEDYWQASATARGAVVLHKGGATLGPYLGDTFALVEAPGADGARLLNARGVTVDGRGYALVPSLSAYRYNRITLDPAGMDSQAELQESTRTVAPYAGAAIRLAFRVNQGQGVLIKIKRPSGEGVPMGAMVKTEAGEEVGLVGQASSAYARLPDDQGTLIVSWGDNEDAACHLAYALPKDVATRSVVHLTGICE